MPRVGSPNGKTSKEIIDFVMENFGNKPFKLREIENKEIKRKMKKYLSFSGNIPNLVSKHFDIEFDYNKKTHTFKLKRG